MGLLSRRNFLKTTGAAVSATCAAAAPRLPFTQHKMPVGLQLYSVRDLLPRDFDGTLDRVHKAGYTVVEAAGFYDRGPMVFLNEVSNAGLHCVSAHYTLSLLETQLDQLLDFADRLELKYIICSSSGGMHRNPATKGPPTMDDWHWIAEEFNRIGAKVKAAKMTFGVHNHTPEFATIDGVCVYDELLRLTEPSLVVFEMDAGWVHAAGHDPVAYLTKSPERFPLMHVKDMLKGADGKMQMTALGAGEIDYHPIMRAATGLKYYFVEQETFDMDPMDELRADAAYMRGLGV